MPLKIVYLDDEAVLLELFSEIFSSEEIVIKTFTEPEDAILEVQQNCPDLIFLDYRLPKTTGEEVARRMHVSVPKALITGDLTTSALPDFVKVFHKPYGVAEMKSFISHFMKEDHDLIAS